MFGGGALDELAAAARMSIPVHIGMEAWPTLVVRANASATGFEIGMPSVGDFDAVRSSEHNDDVRDSASLLYARPMDSSIGEALPVLLPLPPDPPAFAWPNTTRDLLTLMSTKEPVPLLSAILRHSSSAVPRAPVLTWLPRGALGDDPGIRWRVFQLLLPSLPVVAVPCCCFAWPPTELVT